ncbi:MAG: hypothetical protein MUC63_05105 [Planctomycetes bacterium]|jgi:uncharacterized membrane protein YgcG|nr:hypothetical protein [Planctomycetota bacterium]
MAKASSRKDKPAGEPEAGAPAAGAAGGDEKVVIDWAGEKFMTALLILSFAFIFLGILINYINMYKKFDTPIFGMFAKAEQDMVKNKVYAAKADGEPGAAEGEGGGGSEGEGGGGEQPAASEGGGGGEEGGGGD